MIWIAFFLCAYTKIFMQFLQIYYLYNITNMIITLRGCIKNV